MAKTLTRPMYGWDLVYSSHESSVKKKDDILILLVHWCLTHKGFKCVQRPSVEAEEVESSRSVSHLEGHSTEILPQGWNLRADGNYIIHYNIDGVPYVLRSTRAEDILVINLLRSTDNTVTSIAFQVEVLVQNLTGSIENMVPEYKSVLNTVQEKLITPLHCTYVDAQTQTPESQQAAARSRSWSELYDNRERTQPGTNPSMDPRNVGRSDVDPLAHMIPGGGGGGMLFDPFRRDRGVPLGAGTFPPGSVPPGARFDPIGPLNPQPETPHPLRPGGFQPDPDHLPPPGFEDFMM